MATSTIVTITDDIDGAAGAETFELEYGGIRYSIDLLVKNRARFDKAVARMQRLDTRCEARQQLLGARRRQPAARGPTSATSAPGDESKDGR